MLPLFLILALVLPAAEWTRYRGPNGSGVSPDTGLPSEVGKEKNLVWKTAAPKGNSSPIVVGNRVFLTGHQEDERILLCFDARTGRELWRSSIRRARKEDFHPINGPVTPTPATDGVNVYVFFPEYGLLSFSFDGKERWRVPLGPFDSIQGLAASPLYEDGLVVLLIDQPHDSYIAGFDAKTGKSRWKITRPSGFMGGYSTPAVYRPKSGPAQLVTAGAMEVTAYQLLTGERIWWWSGGNMAPAALPVIDGDTLYTLEPVGEGAPPFSRMLYVDKNKDGKVQLDEYDRNTPDGAIMYRVMKSVDEFFGNKDGAVDEAEYNKAFAVTDSGGLHAIRVGSKGELAKSSIRWRHTKSLPYVTSPVIYQGIVYVVKDGGIMQALDAENGQVLKQGRLKDAGGEYYASPIAAGGKLFFLDKDGKLSIVKAGKDWEILSTSDLDEQAIATPAIAYNKLFVRTAGTLYCFGSSP